MKEISGRVPPPRIFRSNKEMNQIFHFENDQAVQVTFINIVIVQTLDFEVI